MYLAYSSRRNVNIWPGFVDALSALLMVIIFLLMIFSVSQFYLSDALTGKERTLVELNRQVVHLADMLALEESSNKNLEEQVGQLIAQLSTKSSELDNLQEDVDMLTELRESLENQVSELSIKLQDSSQTLQAEQEISARSLSQIELLNYQVKALREQLGAVSKALGLELNAENENIEDIAKRLNVALAEKAQELSRYRSDFFGRLREVLGDNPNIRVVGDRFVLQSELLFESASAELGEGGKKQVKALADTLKKVAAEIPDDIDWIVRIDGHTDRRSISSDKFPSNWELSTARALAIVKFVIDEGVEPKRLAATGFGEFHPLDPAKTVQAYAKNRRIEIKLTSR